MLTFQCFHRNPKNSEFYVPVLFNSRELNPFPFAEFDSNLIKF
jgi:hypothetical protein